MSMGGMVRGHEAGYSPRRHHDKNSHLAERVVGYSVIAEYDEEKQGLRNEGGNDNRLSVGDDQSWVLWKSAGTDIREISSFSVAFSAVVVLAGAKPEMVPLFTRDSPDDRYESKVPRIGQDLPKTPVFPVGTTGHVSAAMVEDAQEDIFHPDWTKSLVSVSEPGADQDMSDELYDANTRGGLHGTRHAPLHRLIQALSLSFRTGGTRTRGGGTKAIGLSLTHSGGADQTITGLPFIDNEEGSIGLGSNSFGGGPFRVGCTKHNVGIDDLGRTIHPLHLGGNTLFHNGGGWDAPLRFLNDVWRVTGGPALADYWEEARLVYDRDSTHSVAQPDGTSKTYPGLWRWQVPMPLSIQNGPWWDGRGSTSLGGTTGNRRPSTVTPSGGGSSGGSGAPARNRVPFRNPRFKGRSRNGRQVDQSRKGAVPPSKQNPPWTWPRKPGKGPKGGGKKPQGGGKKPKPFVPDESSLDPILFEDPPDQKETIFEDTTKDLGLPAPTNKNACPPKAVSSNEITTPALSFIAAPTGTNAPAIGGGTVPSNLGTMPGATQMHPIATGGGTSDSAKSFNDPCGWPVAEESALVVIGGGNGLQETIGGDFDPCRGGKTAASVTRINIPAGMASIDTGHPHQNNSTVTRGGHRIQGSTTACPSVLTINPVDSSGAVDSTVGMEMDAGGVDFKGTLKNNGTLVTSGSGNNSIGGNGADGAIVLSANTSYGTVVNATAFTLNATYKTYAALNKALIIKATGAVTVNGTLSGKGRGYVEPF